MQFIEKNEFKAEYLDGGIEEIVLYFFGDISENDQKTIKLFMLKIKKNRSIRS